MRRLARLFAERHSLGVEAAGVVVLYAVYETARGLVAGDAGAARQHARSIASLERALHLFDEGRVQHVAHALPALLSLLGVLYLTMHLTVTGGCLLWLHRRRPHAFPAVRTALLVASGIALVGYVAFPAAPPRMAGIGVSDTIARNGVDLNHGFISALYNPFAAVPSIHICYALIVAAALIRYGRSRALRIAAAAYPLLVLLVIVATGNHFFFDAFAGAIVALVATAAVELRLTSLYRVRLPVPAKA